MSERNDREPCRTCLSYEKKAKKETLLATAQLPQGDLFTDAFYR
ncbi:MAG: hypothetical protein ACFB8W_24320 [Elainellaceae cyanobacterium]